MELYDVIIIGSGPAGLTAALYTTRANLKTLLIAGGKWGGQLMLTTEVENYPGFKKITGMELVSKLKEHALDYNIEIKEERAENVKKSGSKVLERLNDSNASVWRL